MKEVRLVIRGRRVFGHHTNIIATYFFPKHCLLDKVSRIPNLNRHILIFNAEYNLYKGISMKPLLLIAEDNPDVRDNLKITLEFNDYEVRLASNGKKALALLQRIERVPDMIISDIVNIK